MKRMRKILSRLQRTASSPGSEEGQAVVDYILTLAIIVTVVTVLSLGFRTSLFKLWQTFAREISAACPDCPPDPSIRL